MVQNIHFTDLISLKILRLISDRNILNKLTNNGNNIITIRHNDYSNLMISINE